MNIIAFKSKLLKVIAPILFKTKKISVNDANKYNIISIKPDNIKYLIHSTFNVAIVTIDGRAKYFRECRIHSDKRSYIKKVLEDYFAFVNPCDKSDEIIKELNEYLLSKHNLRKFMKMGVKNDPDSAVSQYFKYGDSSVIGIPKQHSQKLDSVLFDLVQFMWGEIYLYFLNGNLSKSHFQTFNSNRQIATYKIASEINCQDLIPKTEYINLDVEGVCKKFGTLMDAAPGVSPEDLTDDKRKCVSSKLQEQFIKLTFLDIICRHTDHRAGHDGNYNVSIGHDGIIYNICAFDNDAPTSFNLSSNIRFTTSGKTTPITDKNGILNLSGIPTSCFEQFINIKSSRLLLVTNDNLTWIQRFFICVRNRKLHNALIKTSKKCPGKIIAVENWNQNSINQELNYCKEEGIVSYFYSYYELLY